MLLQVSGNGYHHLALNGRCYEFIMKPHKNWPDAEHDCNTRVWGGGGGGWSSCIHGCMTEQNVVFNQLRVSSSYAGNIKKYLCMIYATLNDNH